MNYGLNEDQSSLLAGLEQLISGIAPPVPTEARTYAEATDLEAALAEAGYLDLAREPDFGLLGAALVVERLARLPHAIECGARALVAPAFDIDAGPGPVALAAAVDAPARFLPRAGLLLVDGQTQAQIYRVDAKAVDPVETLFAYPYGRARPEALTLIGTGDASALRRRWRIALASESAGAMAAALAHMIEHVTTRQAFGRPLGAFQAIQHRLAMAAEMVEAVKWLSLKAAWSDSDADAAIAAGFAQSRIAGFTYDLHQFSGAMGLTLEFPLHYWTYRLRALAGELGGASLQARAAASFIWNVAA
ncbi:Acyl-CoA dehydrogenase, short-chain specific [compost metagenome]